MGAKGGSSVHKFVSSRIEKLKYKAPSLHITEEMGLYCFVMQWLVK